MKAKVSDRALVARIRRKLAKDGETLKSCRADSQWYGDLGDWYIVNTNTNTITAQHCDLERLGREIGALKPFEELGAAAD